MRRRGGWGNDSICSRATEGVAFCCDKDSTTTYGFEPAVLRQSTINYAYMATSVEVVMETTSALGITVHY
jgi:hypothetical protein